MLPSVERTRVGYSGGTTGKVAYFNMGDHTESIQIVFDRRKSSYDDILESFWRNHSPTVRSSKQYMSAIFCHSPEQEAAAKASKAKYERRTGKKAVTVITRFTGFTTAEGYHQKYLLKRRGALVAMLSLNSDEDFVLSKLACRLNGYVNESGHKEDFLAEAASLGLSEEEVSKILYTMT